MADTAPPTPAPAAQAAAPLRARYESLQKKAQAMSTSRGKLQKEMEDQIKEKLKEFDGELADVLKQKRAAFATWESADAREKMLAAQKATAEEAEKRRKASTQPIPNPGEAARKYLDEIARQQATTPIRNP